MAIEAAKLPCCGAIAEKERGAWMPHDPRARCDGTGMSPRELAEEDAATAAESAWEAERDYRLTNAQRHAQDHPELVDDYSDADPGL